eukprot:TRINITY_DN4179_c0_g2_i1.p1 TRINITY_DN4179_c0_g2~~TRINITY_DN4179_c0_g2_i1.p1  ORF type:complete len:269 (+),score=42.85 TRINITY_DN4179_c0_g2_i1:169-975(+)
MQTSSSTVATTTTAVPDTNQPSTGLTSLVSRVASYLLKQSTRPVIATTTSCHDDVSTVVPCLCPHAPRARVCVVPTSDLHHPGRVYLTCANHGTGAPTCSFFQWCRTDPTTPPTANACQQPHHQPNVVARRDSCPPVYRSRGSRSRGQHYDKSAPIPIPKRSVNGDRDTTGKAIEQHNQQAHAETYPQQQQQPPARVRPTNTSAARGINNNNNKNNGTAMRRLPSKQQKPCDCKTEGCAKCDLTSPCYFDFFAFETDIEAAPLSQVVV